MKKVIGITGSIGSGKSYAVKIFKKICEKWKLKATFLDVDDIRRNILVKENIDRAKLNQKIYKDQEEMRKYKEFINPKIKEHLIEQIDNNDGFIFIEWALLVEEDLSDLVDSIIMIYCSKQKQIERLKDGDLGEKEVIKRINLQLTNEQKLEKIKKLHKECYVIDTTDNPEIHEYENILRKEGLYE